ncbi:putative HTH-type transcriptional regulator AscG [Citrobacter youngae ATCC 29220]|uniref:Putative HTH-type transcriptional regulator AscG n=1 Tax=Citrobacter youngae ATCC 29220 TaxID=500640 RepID=D4BHC6_9ENTR|nr:putative HTH-type transcriptional regulator AscG [Citrobacter youngae ATCC 29220]
MLARSLAAKTTQTLGLVVTNTLYHGVYFSELLFHTARMAEDKGRQLLLADGKHSAEEERQAIQYLLDLRCDAIMIYPRFLSVEEIDDIIDALAPYTIPALSSVKIPVTEMIQETIGRLIFMLGDGAFTPPKTFTGELIQRGSVAPPVSR